MIGRRHFAFVSGIGLLSGPTWAAAQGRKIWRIGVLSLASPLSVSDLTAALLKGMLEHGYVEGTNLHREARWGHGDVKALAGLAVELVAIRPDAIVTIGPDPTYAAASATKSIPIVFITLSQPVERGLIDSLARPGRNLTGLSSDLGADAAVKALEILKEAVPKSSRFAILAQEGGVSGFIRDELQAGARRMGVEAEFFGVKAVSDYDEALGRIARWTPHALLVAPSVLNFLQRKRIVNFAAARGLPAMFPFAEAVRDGGLMSFGADIGDLFRRAGAYVDKIFRGAKPAELPVEQPTKFELTINLKVANTLGLSIPESVILRAAAVIE